MARASSDCQLQRYSSGVGFDVGLASVCGGFAFGAGRETPMLRSTYPKPFFNSPRKPIVTKFLSLPLQRVNRSVRPYLFFAGAVTGCGVAGGVVGARPITIESAPGGKGLLAFASSRLTCQICVSVSVSL